MNNYKFAPFTGINKLPERINLVLGEALGEKPGERKGLFQGYSPDPKGLSARVKQGGGGVGRVKGKRENSTFKFGPFYHSLQLGRQF